MSLNYQVLFAVLAAVVICYLRKYELGLIVSVFFLVLLPDSISIEFSEALPNITIHRLIVAVTLFFWIKNKEINKDIRDSPFFKAQVGIAACYLVSTLFAGIFSVSFKRWLYYFMESFVMFCILQSSLRDPKLIQGIIRSVGLGLVGVSLIAFFQKYTGHSIYDILPRYRHAYQFEVLAARGRLQRGDIISTYGHRILLGVGCAIGAAKFLIDFTAQHKRIEQLRVLAACAICCGALYFSLSRGPWVSFAAGLAWLCLLVPRQFIKPCAVLGVMAVALFAVKPGTLATIQGLSNSTLNADSLKGSSFRWRMTVVNMAISKLSSSDPLHFLFGYGGGSHVYNDFGEVELSTGRTVTMESWDCEFAVNLYEQGIVGFFFIAMLYGSFVFRTGKFLRTPEQAYTGAMLFAVGTLVIILVSKLSVRIFAPQLVYLEAIGLAIASRLLQDECSPKQEPVSE